eukprot:1142841-Pelagomonas_calceolata.AAC.8
MPAPCPLHTPHPHPRLCTLHIHKCPDLCMLHINTRALPRLPVGLLYTPMQEGRPLCRGCPSAQRRLPAWQQGLTRGQSHSRSGLAHTQEIDRQLGGATRVPKEVHHARGGLPMRRIPKKQMEERLNAH